MLFKLIPNVLYIEIYKIFTRRFFSSFFTAKQEGSRYILLDNENINVIQEITFK